MAGGDGVEPHAGAVVPHRQREAALDRAGLDPDRGAGPPGRRHVLDAVLDERLERERGHQGPLQRGGDVDRVAQPVAEPGLLDLEVVGDDPQLLAERHRAAPGGVEREAEERGQPLHQPFCPGRVLLDQRRDRVERVEEEVGLEPRLEGASRASVASFWARSRSSSWVRSSRVVASSRERIVS